MKAVSTLVLLTVALQCAYSAAQLDFVRSNSHRTVGFSTITNPTTAPASIHNGVAEIPENLPGSGAAARRLRDGSATGTVVIVGRNGGGHQPLRNGEPAQ
ncbi:hypothetical protein PHYPSEUDO_001282 [Phytophthora pseudosyringae]|uniref:RxLR effector protein n=1 Tax=Phytophthora pseudosyringae TaxID=221518 RepID=A0A8T1V2B5_9STRA|nr:hypothetical protein PHYPSEUDO_001282 [Phytophthora pseudosyringae]